MAAQKPSIPKGTRDFGPTEVAKRKHILHTIEKVFIKYGFMPIETPTMENLSTLQGKYGDEGDQLLFKVLNSGDYLKDLKEANERGMTNDQADRTFLPSFSGKLSDLDHKASTSYIAEKGLRYDLTVPFARYVVMHQNEISFPFRRYQMQPVWRADRPQKGRYREFWQCDADIVGSDSLLNELDLIQIYLEVFRNLNLKVNVKMNHRKILVGLAEILGLDNNLVAMTIALDKLDKIGMTQVATELKELGGNPTAIDNFVEFEKQVKDNKGTAAGIIGKYFTQNASSAEALLQIATVAGYLNGTETRQVIHDIALARGLSYYTGCIFEVVVNDERCSLKSSIGGGGRYDNLTGIFGLPNVSGVGISFGLDRIYDVLEELNLFPAELNQSSTRLLFCTENEETLGSALHLLRQTRDAGIAAEIFTEKVNPKKPLEKPVKYATGKKIPFLCLVKGQELTLKNLASGDQQQLSIVEIIAQLSR